jgi:hypothetical protein
VFSVPITVKYFVRYTKSQVNDETFLRLLDVSYFVGGGYPPTPLHPLRLLIPPFLLVIEAHQVITTHGL